MNEIYLVASGDEFEGTNIIAAYTSAITATTVSKESEDWYVWGPIPVDALTEEEVLDGYKFYVFYTEPGGEIIGVSYTDFDPSPMGFRKTWANKPQVLLLSIKDNNKVSAINRANKIVANILEAGLWGDPKAIELYCKEVE